MIASFGKNLRNPVVLAEVFLTECPFGKRA